uniref:Chitin-binding type-2 domain-containing protein n=1 Tax=Anopheles farauti TaxID=69004 RepID=A0A182QJR7_9DIPT
MYQGTTCEIKMIHDSKMRSVGLLVLAALIGCATAQVTQKPCDTDGFFPHPTECTMYISCYGGISYEMTCPDGKYFNSTELVCDKKENVQCVVNNCPPEGIVFLPIPGVCDRYTICIEGQAFENTCDTGLYFDAVLGECNLKNETDCVVNPCQNPVPDPPILEIHPNEADCQQYILCVKGEPNVRNCAPGLFFDPDLLQCVMADDCICPDGKYYDSAKTLCDIPANVPCTVGPCSGNTGIAAKAIPNICTSYTLCLDENAFNRTCADGTLFDETFGDCVIARDSKCVENPCVTVDPATAVPTTFYPVLNSCKNFQKLPPRDID